MTHEEWMREAAILQLRLLTALTFIIAKPPSPDEPEINDVVNRINGLVDKSEKIKDPQ